MGKNVLVFEDGADRDAAARFLGDVFEYRIRGESVPDGSKAVLFFPGQFAGEYRVYTGPDFIGLIPGFPDKITACKWIKEHSASSEQPNTPETPEDIIGPPLEASPAPVSLPPAEDAGQQFNDEAYPFQCLGYENGYYYYLPFHSEQIVRMSAENHDKKHLPKLIAPIEFWESTWAGIRAVKDEKGKTVGTEKAGVDWEGAARHLIYDMQVRAGVYRGSGNIRRLGVWKDRGRVVIHLGDRLVMAGDGVLESSQGFKISEFKSKFIYEKRFRIEDEEAAPLGNTGAFKLIQILEKFSWHRKVEDSRLMAGWIVAGMIGGALPWRPHIWINGPAGCGKSSVLKEILKPILGECVAADIEGATTEAAIRQTVNHSSFPILYDEAEAANKRGQDRMKLILELMRSSASPNGGKITKGTPGGSTVEYYVQSCFCLASISNPTELKADISRTVNICMGDNKGGVSWDELQREIRTELDSDWCAGFRARVFHLAPVILFNIRVFIKVFGEEFKSQRDGDVYGCLLGSAWSIANNEVVTEEAARAWVAGKDWSEERAKMEESEDVNCMKDILGRIINIGEGYNEGRSIFELIRFIHTHKITAPELWEDSKEVVRERLRVYRGAIARNGVRYLDDGQSHWVVIDNRNQQISASLRDTLFASNWKVHLRRLRLDVENVWYEAEKLKHPYRGSRGTKIPYEIVDFYMGDEEEDTEIVKQFVNTNSF